jgi:hypothetical protein
VKEFAIDPSMVIWLSSYSTMRLPSCRWLGEVSHLVNSLATHPAREAASAATPSCKQPSPQKTVLVSFTHVERPKLTVSLVAKQREAFFVVRSSQVRLSHCKSNAVGYALSERSRCDLDT